MNVWLLGHAGLYNRGCDAIVRSTVSLLGQRFPECRFTLWSHDKPADAGRIRDHRIRVVDELSDWANPLLPYRAVRKLSQHCGTAARSPLYRLIPRKPECALSIGGDNFTLDYGIPQRYVDQGNLLMDAGVPFVIWGASIGPFAADKEYESRMAQFLRRVSLITVRESISREYLETLGVLENVASVHDPAFALDPEPYSGPESDFLNGGAVVGFNISALVARWCPARNLDEMLGEVQSFLAAILRAGHRVLLIPHVSKKGGGIDRDDEQVLGLVESRFPNARRDVRLLRGGLSARQLKWVISQCRFFIGARTHATIAAYSTAVPTISIGYSVKARGICRDLFGHEHYVVPAETLCAATLLGAWDRLTHDEHTVRCELERKRGEMLYGAKRNADALFGLLTSKANAP